MTSFLVLTAPSEAACAAGAVAVAVILRSFRSTGVPDSRMAGLLAAKDEAELAVGGVLLDQGVAGRARPRGEVLDRARVRGDDFDELAGRDCLDALRRSENRQRTRKSAGVDLELDVEIAHLV